MGRIISFLAVTGRNGKIKKLHFKSRILNHGIFGAGYVFVVGNGHVHYGKLSSTRDFHPLAARVMSPSPSAKITKSISRHLKSALETKLPQLRTIALNDWDDTVHHFISRFFSLEVLFCFPTVNILFKF